MIYIGIINIKVWNLEQTFFEKQYKEDDEIYRAGTHLIELINDKSYMKNSLIHLNEISHLMLQIVNSDSTTSEIKRYFFLDRIKKRIWMI